MKIERVPEAKPEGDITFLSYGKEETVHANAFSDLYAIKNTWTTATLFSTPTDFVFKMYIGTTQDFTKDNAIASYQFDKLPQGHQLGLTEDEMKALWKKTSEKYLYIRFECAGETTVLPTLWAPSECVTKTKVIKPATPVTVAGKSTANHRLLYTDWTGGDMTIDWQSKLGECPFYLGDSCISLMGDDPHAFYSGRIGQNNTFSFSAADIASWAPYVDGDGYLYAVFNPDGKGTVTITTTAEDEKDPEDTKPDIPHATISVSCEDGDPHTLLVTVSEPQTLTVTANGTTVEQWEATPSDPHTLNLPSGLYNLTGAKEEVLLFVP